MKAVNYYLIVEKIKEPKKVGGLLITDDLDSETTKIKKAKQLNINIMGINEFKKHISHNL